MLEAEPQTAGYAVRPRSSAPRPAGVTAARALPSRPPLPAAERRSERAAGERPRGGRLPRSEARLLTWTVAWAIVVCGLLVLYLAAYAHLTMLGIEQSKASHEMREKWQQNQILRAQEAALKNPDRIAARAVRLGLTKDSPRVDYIRPAPASAGVAAPVGPSVLGQTTGSGASPDDGAAQAGGKADSQGMNSGPKTEDNLTTRND